MKICHVVWGMEMGGIETMLVNIANYQTAQGHDVHIMVVDNALSGILVDALAPAITIHRIGRRPGSHSLIPLVKMNACMLQLNPDIIHYHHPKLHIFFLPMCNRRSCTTCHGMALDENLPYYKGVRNLISISDGVRTDILSRAGVDSKVIKNGIVVADYALRPNEPIHNPIKLVQIGRLNTEIKGQDILLKAMSKIKLSGIEFKLHFIGGGKDLEKLQKLTTEYGLSDEVMFMGECKPEFIRDHLCDYDLLVQPSRHEGFGLTIAEAMAAKVPVLVSDIEPQLEVIGGGKYGYTFASENADALAEAINKFLSQGLDGNKLDKAHEFAFKNYDVSRTAQEYLDYYKDKIAIKQ